MKVLIFIAFFLSSALYSISALAAEPGYNEAMGYFVQRRNQQRAIAQGQQQESPVYQSLEADSSSQGPLQSYQSNVSKRTKYFLSLGFEQGNNSFEEARVLELGIATNASKWIQSNLSLEWRSVVGDSGDGFAFMYSVQPSSVLFFLGPEIGFGAGRAWVVGNGEGFTSLRLGLNISNPWSRRFLVAFNVYYRRDQGLRDSFHDDRVGAVLRFGF
jgi:hypothetical protein